MYVRRINIYYWNSNKYRVKSNCPNRKFLNESELKEILRIAQEGESKLKEMSDRATILSEKWRVKTSKPKNSSLGKVERSPKNFQTVV